MVAHSPESLLAAYRLVRSLRLELYDDQADANRDDLDLFGTRAQFGAPMTYLSAMPAATISGLSLGLQALLGGEMIVERPMYDADQILCSIRRLSVTSIGLPPVVALAMARGQRKKAHNIETLLVLGMGGNPVAPELHGPLEELFECRVMTGYGSTELGGAVMATRFLDQPAPWSVGRPVPGVKAAQDPGSGELLIQSPAMAMGYMNDQGVVEPFPLDTGWFRTGDALSWDAFTETYSYEHRLSEEIVRGGRKIHPEDIERVLLDCEGVAEAVVVGVPSRLVGEEDVVAAIVLKFPIAIAELRHRCIDRLGTTWCPRSIRTMDRIPRLASGKPNRQQIRDSLAIER
jgi:acyl-CoA synthetase (AMP-forming)/AMP-acid ligase II